MKMLMILRMTLIQMLMTLKWDVDHTTKGNDYYTDLNISRYELELE